MSWAELAVLDSSAAPEQYVGRLTWPPKSLPSQLTQQMVSREWPVEVSKAVGMPPAEWSPGIERLEWETADFAVRYESLSVGTVLGPSSHWPHVFAVMQALAGRFGDGSPVGRRPRAPSPRPSRPSPRRA